LSVFHTTLLEGRWVHGWMGSSIFDCNFITARLSISSSLFFLSFAHTHITHTNGNGGEGRNTPKKKKSFVFIFNLFLPSLVSQRQIGGDSCAYIEIQLRKRERERKRRGQKGGEGWMEGGMVYRRGKPSEKGRKKRREEGSLYFVDDEKKKDGKETKKE